MSTKSCLPQPQVGAESKMRNTLKGEEGQATKSLSQGALKGGRRCLRSLTEGQKKKTVKARGEQP